MRKICIILRMLILFTGCSSEKKNNELFGSIDELIAAMHYDPIVADEMNKFVEFLLKRKSFQHEKM